MYPSYFSYAQVPQQFSKISQQPAQPFPATRYFPVPPFMPPPPTPEQEIEALEAYKANPEEELQGVEARIKELGKHLTKKE